MLFLATHVNRLDKKGRISVPASFRAALAGQPFQGIVAYPSLAHTCIEACGMERIGKMNTFIESLPPFSEERDALATVIFGESVQLAFDTEGRVSVPHSLLAFAGIDAEAVFIGKGEIFEIWQPKAFEAHTKQARALVKEKRHVMQRGKP
jgi:MraZ protein